MYRGQWALSNDINQMRRHVCRGLATVRKANNVWPSPNAVNLCLLSYSLAPGTIGIGITAPKSCLHVASTSGSGIWLTNTDITSGTSGSGGYISTGAGSDSTYTIMQGFQLLAPDWHLIFEDMICKTLAMLKDIKNRGQTEA